MGEGFVKLQRSGTTIDLLSDPNAMHLITVIAIRARYSDEPNLRGLAFGSALIGDHLSYGLTRAQERSARRRLEKYGLASFRTSRSGTVATLLDSRVFCLRDERKLPKNDQLMSQPISERNTRETAINSAISEPTNNQPMTTNKKVSSKAEQNQDTAPTADSLTIQMPENLKTPEIISAWSRWETARRKAKRPLEGWNQMFTEQLSWLSKQGPEKALHSLEQTLRNGWRALYPPDANARKQVLAKKSQFAEAF